MTHGTRAPHTTQYLLESLGGVEANTGFVRAVLDGNADGEVWASSTAGAGAAYARHPYGMSLVWGERVGDVFDDLIRKLAHPQLIPGGEWLQVDPRWAHLPWAESLASAAPHLEILVDTRINFAFDAARYARTRPGIQVPDGWALAPADLDDFHFPGAVVPSQFWRDGEQFLNNGGGWRAQSNAGIAALAFSSFPIYDGVEIGIETLPTIRKLGLGAAVAAAMIDDALNQGLSPIWACRRGNTGSYRLATRLGFIPRRTLPSLHLRVGSDPGLSGSR